MEVAEVISSHTGSVPPLDRMRKILALARQGEGGEKENAQRMLDRLLQKHGLTIAHLDEPDVEERLFTIRDETDAKILMQVIYRVVGPTFELFRYQHDRKRKNVRMSRLSSQQFAEVRFLWHLYREQWTREVEALLSAFIQKHKLFGAPISTDRAKMSPEEFAAMQRRMRALDEVHEHKGIESQSPSKGGLAS